MSSGYVLSRREGELDRIAYEIVKELFRGLYIPQEEEEEEEGTSISASNLRNMLEAAREAKRKRSWILFKLKAIYVARKARRGEPLYKFVEKLIKQVSSKARDESEKVELAEKVLTASIYMYNALRKGFGSLVYGNGG